MANKWSPIADECGFVGRTNAAGDEIGSQVIAARVVCGIMRLALLLERTYAPYPKWSGSAFNRLNCASTLAPLLAASLSAQDWQLREEALGRACEFVGWPHQELGAAGSFKPNVSSYFGRPFRVINADEIAEAIQAKIANPVLGVLPLMGSIDQITERYAGNPSALSLPASCRSPL